MSTKPKVSHWYANKKTLETLIKTKKTKQTKFYVMTEEVILKRGSSELKPKDIVYVKEQFSFVNVVDNEFIVYKEDGLCLPVKTIDGVKSFTKNYIRKSIILEHKHLSKLKFNLSSTLRNELCRFKLEVIEHKGTFVIFKFI